MLVPRDIREGPTMASSQEHLQAPLNGMPPCRAPPFELIQPHPDLRDL